MADSPRFDPLASRAYVLFRSELLERLKHVDELIKTGGETGAEDVATIGRMFHTIKGGAGFFGLHEVARAAERLEALFLERAERDSAEVAQLVEALRRLSVSLPEPTGGSNRCPTS